MGLKAGELTESNIVAGSLRGLAFERQRLPSVAHKGTELGCGHKLRVRSSLDVVVEGKVAAEIKRVKELLPVRGAQHLKCVRLGGLEVGLPVDFRVVLKDGLRRKVL